MGREREGDPIFFIAAAIFLVSFPKRLEGFHLPSLILYQLYQLQLMKQIVLLSLNGMTDRRDEKIRFLGLLLLEKTALYSLGC